MAAVQFSYLAENKRILLCNSSNGRLCSEKGCAHTNGDTRENGHESCKREDTAGMHTKARTAGAVAAA